MLMPSGYRVVYRGQRYRDGDVEGEEMTLLDEETGAEVATVPVTDLDEWYWFSTQCTYVGEPFQIMSEEDGQYVLYFVGGNGIKIAEVWRAKVKTDAAEGTSHWRENDMFTFLARVPKSAVQNVHEHHDDTLAAWRKQHGRA
jgi:hypothetical protein